jgi:HSP20 family protein
MLARRMESSPLVRLQNEMTRLFEDFFEDIPALRPYSAGYPAVNVWDDGKCGHIEAELPGMTMNDVEVMVSGNEVAIRGHRKISRREGVSWDRRERSEGEFSRTLTLPFEVNADKVEAKLCNGVLCVNLPKSESSLPKKVKVHTA